MKIKEQAQQGVPKKTFEYALQMLNNQIRLTEQKLTIEVDNVVNHYFHTKEYEIASVKDRVKQMQMNKKVPQLEKIKLFSPLTMKEPVKRLS